MQSFIVLFHVLLLSYCFIHFIIIIIIIIIIIKRGWQWNAGRESDLHPISPKTPASQ